MATREVIGTDEQCLKQVGLVLLKPDTLEFFMENHFIRDFSDLGLDTRYRQIIQLSSGDVINIYPDLTENPEILPIVLQYMVSGPSMILLLRGRLDIAELGEEDVQDYIRKKKGRANEMGLRRKYIHIFEDELKSLYPERRRFLFELSRNRIHAPDNIQEAIQTLIHLWPKLEHTRLYESLPDQYNALRRKLSLQSYVSR